MKNFTCELKASEKPTFRVKKNNLHTNLKLLENASEK